MANKLNGLELLRFLAALAVVFYHIPSIGVGHFGVDIFFVISGFVMMLSTSNASSQFLLKRVIRIVPLYWLATLGVFTIALVAPNVLRSTDASLIDLTKSLMFIPFDKNGVGHQPVLAVGWTLNYEMYFYALFALSCLISPRFRGLTAVSFVVLNIFLLGSFDNFISKIYSDLIVLEFGLGIALYLILNKNKFQAFGVIGLIGIGALFNFEDGHRLFLFGLPSVFLVLVAVLCSDILPNSSIVHLLGGSSYSLYLCHSYVIRVFDRLVDWFSSENTLLAVSAILISSIGSIIVAVLLFKYFENPILNYLRRTFINKKL